MSAKGTGNDAFEPNTAPIPLDETWVMWKVSGRVAIWIQRVVRVCHFGSSGRRMGAGSFSR